MQHVQTHAPLAPLTTLKVGGNADCLVEVTSVADVHEAVIYAQERDLPLFVLGGGSNVLVPDTGFTGLVLKMAITGRVYVPHDHTYVHLTVGAGEVLDDVIADTVVRGLWGLENLSAIPGSVGAAPVQNVGAYGVEAADRIVSVTVFDTVTHTEITLMKADCAFGYRDSIFKHDVGRRYIVLAVTFTLSIAPAPVLHYGDLMTRFAGATPTQTEVRDTVIAIRGQKFPDWRVVGTAGSFFKNPIIPRAAAEVILREYPELPVYDAGSAHQKISLGYVLDKICHLKGVTDGAVSLYEKQALVLVVVPGTPASAVVYFAKKISDIVKNKIGVDIEWEVVVMK